MMMLMGLFVFVIAIILMLLKRFRVKIMQKLSDFKKNFMWNGFIRSITIAYISLLITNFVQIKMWLQVSEYLDDTTFISSCATLFILASFMVFSLVFVKMRRATLGDLKTMEKWSNLYQDIHMTRNKYTTLYFPIFLFRRIMFVAIPFCLYNWPFLQL